MLRTFFEANGILRRGGLFPGSDLELRDRRPRDASASASASELAAWRRRLFSSGSGLGREVAANFSASRVREPDSAAFEEEPEGGGRGRGESSRKERAAKRRRRAWSEQQRDGFVGEGRIGLHGHPHGCDAMAE